MLPVNTRKYLLNGLAGTPVVIDRMLQQATADDYDRCPDPARFTLREMMAHLADWEGVWLERMTAIKTQETPTLQGYDEGQWAIDHDYAHADFAEQQQSFRERRSTLMLVLNELSPEEWERLGNHTELGMLSMEALAVQILGHDAYHLQQIAEWLA